MAWTNLNTCFSFTETFGTTLKQLSSTNCSEVLISNYSSAPLYIFDNNNNAPGNAFVLPPSGRETIRGITDSAQVSAYFITTPGLVSYRTQCFSSFPLNIY